MAAQRVATKRRSTPCDNCPARTRLHRVKFCGRTLDLCEDCLKALRNIKQEQEDAKVIEGAHIAEDLTQGQPGG